MAETTGTSGAGSKYGGHKEGDGKAGAPPVTSPVPERREGEINPSAPNDSTVTPGSVAEQQNGS